jgi:hypothetical protein
VQRRVPNDAWFLLPAPAVPDRDGAEAAAVTVRGWHGAGGGVYRSAPAAAWAMRVATGSGCDT